jgi:hypothetical protein
MGNEVGKWHDLGGQIMLTPLPSASYLVGCLRYTPLETEQRRLRMLPGCWWMQATFMRRRRKEQCRVSSESDLYCI